MVEKVAQVASVATVAPVATVASAARVASVGSYIYENFWYFSHDFYDKKSMFTKQIRKSRTRQLDIFVFTGFCIPGADFRRQRNLGWLPEPA